MKALLKSITLPKFVSLKWKVVLILGLLLLCINAVFPIINYLELKNQFTEQRQDQHARFARQMNALIQQAYLQLQKIGELLPALEGMNEALTSNDAKSLHRYFDPHWYPLQIQQNVDTIGFFDRRGQLIIYWGPNQPIYTKEKLRPLVTQAIALEQPTTLLDCHTTCTKYAIVPLLNNGFTVGVVLVGSSLADTILEFKQFTTTDIGILTRFSSTTQSAIESADSYSQPNWQSRIIALTNANHNIKLVKLASTNTDSIDQAHQGIVINHQQRAFEIKTLMFDEFELHGEGYLITINDITDYLTEINTAAMKNISAGVAGLILSSAVLLMVLWQPLTRLKSTAKNLPLLAQRAFTDVRNSIGKTVIRSHMKDEIDLLGETTIALSYQLETLENRVRTHTLSLANKVQELANERDFIKHLIDNAQIIILTHDCHGNILLINDFGVSISGYSKKDFATTHFIHKLTHTQPDSLYACQLAEVASGIRKQIQQETIITCKNGTTRNIVWLHSHLRATGRKEPVMLSVGLDITERKKAETRLAWLADHDPLTGLFNRRRLQEEIDRILTQAKRHQRCGAIFFIDLDQFKLINDTSGHQTGDTLLVEVANKLKNLLRSSDILARLGGDEFTIVTPEISRKNAIIVAKKINHELDGILLSINSIHHKVSASIGIALFPEHGDESQDLLSLADLSMYHAKNAGRGRWHIFEPNQRDQERLHAHVYWKHRIEEALSKNRFTLLFQPILNIATGQISHYEMLLRMLDQQGNLLAPGTFIEVAERTGLIRAIDHMVLRKAFDSIAKLSSTTGSATFSVNLSAHSFEDPELLPLLKELLANNKISSQRLIFEVTETAALADISGSRLLMQSIKNLGCHFALDDFGVGFSSFSYLKELPFDYIKIDGSFIRQITQNSDDQILVKALCDVAKGFGKKIIAEFVENLETLNTLREYQVDFAQGYYIGTPSASLISNGEFSTLN